MQVLSGDLKKSLLKSAMSYREQLADNPAAREYLAARGITEETAQAFGLGFVAEPVFPEEEQYRGRLTIPYKVCSPVHGWSVVSIRYRAIDPDDKPKYRSRKGDTVSLYNPPALLRDTDYICVTEGELDCISAEQAGLAAVGIPGANRWEPWMTRLFRGYKAVYVLQDNDPAGELFSETIAKAVPNTKVIVMRHGDVNDTLCAEGEEYLRGLISE